MLLRQLQKLNDLVNPHPAGDDLVAADTQLHDEARADSLPYRLQEHQREPAAVFKGAAVEVRPVVCQRGQELGHQVAVGSVDEHPVKAAAVQAVGAAGKVVDGLLDVLLIHFPDARVFVRQRHGRGGDAPFRLDEAGADAAPRVHKLAGELRVVGMGRLGHELQMIQLQIAGHVDFRRVIRRRIPVDRRRPQMDERHACGCLHLDEIDIPLCRLTRRIREITDHRRELDPIFQRRPAEIHRREHMLVIVERWHKN